MKVERAWTESRVFHPFIDQDGDITEFMMGTHFTVGLLSLFGGILWIGMDPVHWPISASVLVFLSLVIHGGPYLGKLSPLTKIDNAQLTDKGTVHNRYSYDENWVEGSRDLIYKILDLPKEDQRLFPNDLVTMLSRDLLPKARYEINAGLSNTLAEIRQRNEQRRIMEQKAISHEGVLAAIESTRQNLQIETQTLKEYS